MTDKDIEVPSSTVAATLTADRPSALSFLIETQGEPAPTPRVLNKHHGNIPADAVYCGRGSRLGNRFIIGRDGDRDEVCDKFQEWAMAQPEIMAYIASLRGRDLVCFCAPKRCHCDWILQIANA